MSQPPDNMVKAFDWCQPHWDALRQAIDARGLSPWVAKDGRMAAQAARSDFLATDDSQFDPLIRAWMMMNMKIVDWSGDWSMCPLCQVAIHEPKCPERDMPAGDGQRCILRLPDIIDSCTDAVLDMAKTAKMVPAHAA